MGFGIPPSIVRRRSSSKAPVLYFVLDVMHDALKHVGEIGELRQRMQAARKELNIQFQRIAQIQAQLDRLRVCA